MTSARSPHRLALLALLVPLVLLPALACSQAPPMKPPASAAETRSTRATDLRDAQALLLLLADQKRFEETVFVALLDSSKSIRLDLAVTLGRIGDTRGRGLLQGLLIDIEPEVRRAAAFALGELGAPEAVPALLRASVDDDTETGTLAVEALGKLQAPLADVRRTLTAISPGEAARRLAPALFRFQEDGRVEAAAALLDGPELSPAGAGAAPFAGTVRAGAAYALSRDARAGALPYLRALLADPDPRLRAWAARGLGDVGELADFAALEALLADAASSPRIQAVRAGARIAARTEALPPLAWGGRLAGLVDDPLPGVRAIALESCAAWLAQPEVRKAVLGRLANGEPRERELALLRARRGGRSGGARVGGARCGRPGAGAFGRAPPRRRECSGSTGWWRSWRSIRSRWSGWRPSKPCSPPSAQPQRRRRLEGPPGPPGPRRPQAPQRGRWADRSRRGDRPTVSARPGRDRAHDGARSGRRGTRTLRRQPAAGARRRERWTRSPMPGWPGVRALAARALAVPGDHETAVQILEGLAEDADFLVRREVGGGARAARPAAAGDRTGRHRPHRADLRADPVPDRSRALRRGHHRRAARSGSGSTARRRRSPASRSCSSPARATSTA